MKIKETEEKPTVKLTNNKISSKNSIKKLSTSTDNEIDTYITGFQEEGENSTAFFSRESLPNIKSLEDFLNDKTVNTIVKKYYPDATESDFEKLYNSLAYIDKNYVLAINSMLDTYDISSEQDFTNKFGFSPYGSSTLSEVSGKISKTFNYDYLLLDFFLYAAKNDHEIDNIKDVYLEDENSDSIKFLIKYGNVNLVSDAFSSYLQSKGIDADHISKITDKMKEDANSDIKIEPKEITIPSYYQQDYSDVVLGTGYLGDKVVATSGCGFTSTAMVISYLTGKNITPKELVDDWSKAYYVYDQGMDWNFPNAAANHYDVGSVRQTKDINEAIEALKKGNPVLCSQGPGLFTENGHIIVLSGITEDGNIIVNDPNSENSKDKDYNNKTFDAIDDIDSTAKNYWIFE